MQTNWEYTLGALPLDGLTPQAEAKQLAHMGSQGWELCGVAVRPALAGINGEQKQIALIFHYFKRPVNKILAASTRFTQ